MKSMQFCEQCRQALLRWQMRQACVWCACCTQCTVGKQNLEFMINAKDTSCTPNQWQELTITPMRQPKDLDRGRSGIHGAPRIEKGDDRDLSAGDEVTHQTCRSPWTEQTPRAHAPTAPRPWSLATCQTLLKQAPLLSLIHI